MAWNELSVEQQASRARDMEIYAGMIDYMDEQIGRVLTHLKDTGQYDNTLIRLYFRQWTQQNQHHGLPGIRR